MALMPLAGLSSTPATRPMSAPISRPAAPPPPPAPARNANVSAWRGASDFEPSATAALPAGGVARNKVIDAGTNLTREAQEALAAGGVKNPTAAQMRDAVNAFSTTNRLDDPNRIKAGQSLSLPEDLRRGQLFNELARAVTPGGDTRYGMPAEGFSTDTAALVKGADGLAGLTRKVGPEGVAALFNDHMERTGRPFISLDTTGSDQSVLDVTLRNRRDHLSVGTITGF